MKQQDFRLSSPQWPLGPAGTPGSKALVGGVPWASEAGGQEPFADRSGVGADDAAPDRTASGLPRVFDPAAPVGSAAAANASGNSGFGERLAAFVRNSPAFSVSAALH